MKIENFKDRSPWIHLKEKFFCDICGFATAEKETVDQHSVYLLCTGVSDQRINENSC